MGVVLAGWAEAVEASAGTLFGGSDGSINILTTLISNGAMIEGGSDGAAFPPPGRNRTDETQTALNAVVAKIFYAFAIPSIWQGLVTGPLHHRPRISLRNCRSHSRLNPSGLDSPTWASWDNMLYYLASPSGSAVDPTCGGGDGAAVCCSDQPFGVPEGIDSLDERSELGGGRVTVADLVAG